MTGGDRAGVALSEPLNGGSPEVRVTGPGELQERCKGDPAPGVSPSTVPLHGFSENYAGPIVDHLTTFNRMVTQKLRFALKLLTGIDRMKTNRKEGGDYGGEDYH